MLDDTEIHATTDNDAEALHRLRDRLAERQSELQGTAHDLLDDHLSAMLSLHPELSDAVDVALGLVINCEYDSLKHVLRVLGFAAPNTLGRAAALYDVTLLLEGSDVGRLRQRGLTSLEIDLGLRERWLEVAKERLAANFQGSARQAVRDASADREYRQR